MLSMRTFAVNDGIHGMNRLALYLNAVGLTEEWHFAAGTRFDQTSVDIGFDNTQDAELAWRKHQSDAGTPADGSIPAVATARGE